MNSKPTPQTTIAQLMPKLRFPEFENAEGWEERKLIDISYFINEKISLSQISLNNYISTENISPDFFGVVTASKLPNTKTITYFRKEDILISNIRPYLKKVWSATFDGGASNDVIVIRAKENINSQYLSFLLKNEKFIDYIIVGAKGVKMPRGDINLIKKFSLYCPNPKEQQKIADCLSSLDELITTQNQKLDALKQHKKGLMQNLFPIEGQTTPKLRFPEFENAGEWEEIKIQGIGKVSMCKRILRSETSNIGEIPFYKIGTFGKLADAYITKTLFEKYKQKYSYPNKGDILISASGTIGRLVVFDGQPAYFQDSNIVWIKNNEQTVINSFLYSCYQNTKWTTEDTTIARLYNDNLNNIKILKPEILEQQKIADCLSSLDELITAQSQKLEALKQHKKGLMQNLFPN